MGTARIGHGNLLHLWLWVRVQCEAGEDAWGLEVPAMEVYGSTDSPLRGDWLFPWAK